MKEVKEAEEIQEAGAKADAEAEEQERIKS